jgi:hypothetical protein
MGFSVMWEPPSTFHCVASEDAAEVLVVPVVLPGGEPRSMLHTDTVVSIASSSSAPCDALLVGSFDRFDAATGRTHALVAGVRGDQIDVLDLEPSGDIATTRTFEEVIEAGSEVDAVAVDTRELGDGRLRVAVIWSESGSIFWAYGTIEAVD